MKTIHTLAVYGTLKRFQSNHHIIEGSKFLGESFVKGFDLYDLGNFPAATPSEYEESGFCCEFYQITPETLEATDRLEGFIESDPSSSFYTRKVINHPRFGATYLYIIADHSYIDTCALIASWPLVEKSLT